MASITEQSSTLITVARFVAVTFPTLYAGFTLSDSLTFVGPIINHAPNQKIMAKQWLHGYQYGPLWVPPMIMPATLTNLFLAYLAHTRATSSTAAAILPTLVSPVLTRNLYLAAAATIFSILPITFFYMEPGINGATKWKVQTLLRDEGMKEMPETSIFLPSAHKHGSTQASRRWADGAEMGDLIRRWRSVNNVRWAIAGLAAALSGWATLLQVPA